MPTNDPTLIPRPTMFDRRRRQDASQSALASGGFVVASAVLGSVSLWACTVPPLDPTPTTATTSSAESSTTWSTTPAPTVAPTTTTAAVTTSTAGTGGGTAGAIQRASWGANVTITMGSGTFTFQSNGIPNHSRPAYYAVPKPGISVPRSSSDLMVIADPTGAQSINVTITTSPVYSQTTTRTAGGTIGVMISGAMLFNPYEADQTTIALDNNHTLNGYSFIDSCSGHPNGQRMYHYHGIPYCITAVIDTAGQHSELLGVAYDGFAIYGPQGDGGAAPTDLDECNGHVGVTPGSAAPAYHYHLTEGGYHTLNCLHGVVSQGASASVHAHR